MKKIVFVCATSKMVLHFRTDLIIKYQKEGYKVTVIAFDDTYSEQIKGLSVDFYSVGSCNRSLNPFSLFSLKGKYKKILKEIRPDVVMTFMLKPNIFGVLAAKEVGVEKIYSVIEGAGDAFTYNTLKWRIVRSIISTLYKKSLKIPQKVIFLNNDDREDFIEKGLVNENKSCVVHGIGVNLKQFNSRAINFNGKFLMVARLSVAKGIYVYAQAAKLVKEKYPNIVFGLLGGEGQINLKEFQNETGDFVTYYGETDDVRPYLEDCSVFVLPSYYREGLPMSIMEAQACSRCVITTDWYGCKDTVKDGYNGFLVEPKNVEALVEKITYFIENPEKAKEMGENARKFAEENFCQEKINNQIYNLTN